MISYLLIPFEYILIIVTIKADACLKSHLIIFYSDTWFLLPALNITYDMELKSYEKSNFLFKVYKNKIVSNQFFLIKKNITPAPETFLCCGELYTHIWNGRKNIQTQNINL